MSRSTPCCTCSMPFDTARSPIGWVEFCADNPGDCSGGTSQPRDIVMTQTAWTSPTPPSPVPGMPVKAGPWGPVIDNTVVTLYGHFDLSADLFNSGVFDRHPNLTVHMAHLAGGILAWKAAGLPTES